MKICKSVSRPRRQVWSSKRHNTQLDKTDYSRCMAPIYPNMVYVLLNVHMVKRELMQCFTLLILLVWLTHLLWTLFSGATLHSQYQLGQYFPLQDNDYLQLLYPDRFSGNGEYDGEYHIVTDPDVPPVVHALWKCPIHIKDDIRKERGDVIAHIMVEAYY